MRRMYLESILGLITCFFIGVFAYEITMYEMTTDHDYLLKDYEAAAHQQLLQTIANAQGIEAAQQSMKEFAHLSKLSLFIYTPNDSLPDEVKHYFSGGFDMPIFHDEERELWFKLAGSDATYHYLPDDENPIRQNADLQNDIVWMFFIASFILYSLCHLLVIFWRVKKLETATLSFAQGELSARAETASGRAIGSLNQSFNHMADRIQNLIDSNRALTNAVAHELRTPVFRIQWQAELLKDTNLDEEQRQTIDSIVEDTEEMETMVDELLCYARLDSHRLELTKTTVDVGELLSKGKVRWNKETQLELLIQPKQLASNVSIFADERLLKRALDNVVRNAMKFADQKILIEFENQAQAVTVSVHDDGPGVDEEHIANLFEPFYVGSKARNKAKSGHGLGLSIVHKICEQHGGKVEVGRSALLQGAEFKLTFPVL